MDNGYEISLVIPAYNEEESIEHTLNVSDALLKSIAKNYEIIVVNDGSIDRTAKIINECASLNCAIKPIHNIRNEGSGRSLFKGLKKAQYEFIVTNFADLPFDLKELPHVLALLKNSNTDFAIVVRKDRKANVLFRKITSLVNYWMIRMLFGINAGDYQFVQVYRKRVLDCIDVNSRGTFVPPELIIKALRKGFRYQEYRADFYPRLAGEAKCGSLKTIFQSLYEIISFWFKWKILLYQNKDENCICQ